MTTTETERSQVRNNEKAVTQAFLLARVVHGTGNRVTGYLFQYPLPGYPGITQYLSYFFQKVRDTLFISDNLNKIVRQGWVPFITPALLHEPAMS